MLRRLRAGLPCAVLLLLLAPSGASAARTLMVDPTGAGGAYTTIGAAVAAAEAGDTIAVAKGDYPEVVTIPERLTDLTITGVDGARLLGAAVAEHVLQVQAAGVKVNTLAIEVPAASRSGVRVDEPATAALTGVAVSRTAASSADEPLIDVAGAATIARGFVAQQGGAAGTPAIAAGGAGGVAVLDTTAFSTTGPALLVTASDRNVVQRSTLASTDSGSDAARVVAATAGGRRLVIDSSQLVGGAQAAGLRVMTQTAPATDVTTVALRHATLIGAGQGVALDATAPMALGVPTGTAGSIRATVDGSIVRERSSAKGDPGTLVFPANTVELAFTDSDSPVVADDDRNDRATVTMTRTGFTPDAAKLFGTGLHLRADAPVIDKGPQSPADGESDTDIDGQPRRSGAATDIGADEFVNVAPAARLAASTTTPAQREPVTFTSTVTDDNVGDGVAAYYWDFGDGGQASTTLPDVSHAFAEPGTYTVRLAAVDRGGLPSQISSLTVTVRDVDPPAVTITSPRAGAKLVLNRRKPRRLVMRGTDSDAMGVAEVEVSLRRTVSARSCRHYTGRRFARGRCTSPRWVPARLVGSSWKLATRRRVRVRPGRYELLARATDVTGLRSVPSERSGSVVRFTVR